MTETPQNLTLSSHDPLIYTHVHIYTRIYVHVFPKPSSVIAVAMTGLPAINCRRLHFQLVLHDSSYLYGGMGRMLYSPAEFTVGSA